MARSCCPSAGPACRGIHTSRPNQLWVARKWVDWFNNRWLLESISHVPPAEYELEYHRLNEAQAMAA